MPNPKGNPDNLTPFTTDRHEPLTDRVCIRVGKTLASRIKSIENYPEFCRQALLKALDELDSDNNQS